MWNLNTISKDWAGYVRLAKRHPVTLAGLDIGTSKTAVIIAQLKHSFPKILGFAEVPSIGVAKGCITSPESAAKAILMALEQAINNAVERRPSTAYVSFNGDTVTVKDCLVNLKPGRQDKAFYIKRSGCTAVPGGLAEGESVLQLIPPRDLSGWHVFDKEAGARVVTASTQNIKNILKAVQLAGLEVEDVVFGPVAAAEALLTPAEKELGTILVDIGAGTTSVSIFDLGGLRETAVFPVGGEHILSDLAIGLHTSLNRAVEVLGGCVLTGPGQNKVDLAGSIVEARLSEILYLTGKAIEGFQYPGLLPGGVVCCGGVSLLEGFAPFAESILKIPVRVGKIQFDDHPMRFTLANAWGLVKYGGRCLNSRELTYAAAGRGPGKSVARLIKWLQGRMKN